MADIKEKIKNILEDRVVVDLVSQRTKEFEENYKKDSIHWFKELCFCLLTANFKAWETIDICKKECTNNAFIKYSQENLSKFLKEQNHRFPNARARYIVEARKYSDILKDIIDNFDDEKDARKWVVKSVKGIGYKEASHFLRNVGYKNVAILDRHILKVLHENQVIDEIPKALSGKRYIEIEGLLENLAREVDIDLSELDLFLWYMKTGKVLK